MTSNKLNRVMGFALGCAGVFGFVLLPSVARAGGEAQFESKDTNGDGKISPDEQDAAAARMFGKMDTNADGKVTAAEMTAAKQNLTGKKAEKGEMTAAEKIKKVDTNGDGVLTADEHAAGAKSMFDKMDSDKDGYLTKAEVKAGHDDVAGRVANEGPIEGLAGAAVERAGGGIEQIGFSALVPEGCSVEAVPHRGGAPVPSSGRCSGRAVQLHDVQLKPRGDFGNFDGGTVHEHAHFQHGQGGNEVRSLRVEITGTALPEVKAQCIRSGVDRGERIRLAGDAADLHDHAKPLSACSAFSGEGEVIRCSPTRNPW